VTDLSTRAQAEILLRQRLGIWRVAISAQSDDYEFRGGNLAALQDAASPEILLAGPAGTGKTLALLAKVHRALCDHAGARALIVRKTRASLSETALQIYEDDVLGSDHNIADGPQRDYRRHYNYPNGSQLVTGGLDKPSRIMSSGYDMIYIPEATEITEKDYNVLLTRLRAGVLPMEQMICDANPGPPTHWIKRRSDSQQMRFLQSWHKDNPAFYYADGTLTERGARYMEKLDALTGTDRDRLRDGKWVQAEGAIYKNFTNDNIGEQAAYDPALGAIYWGCDDGYARGEGPGTVSYHPRTILMGQVTPVGGLHIFAEYYATGETHDASIDAVLALGYPPPALCYVDQAAKGFRLALSMKNLPNTAGNDSAKYNVANGIKNVRRLVGDGHGRRLLRVHPGCQNLITEMQSYAYNPGSSASAAGEPAPLKIYDDGPDALRYLSRVVWYAREYE
jgi:phage terminase large subunit